MAENNKKTDFNIKVEDMASVGVSFGHRTSKCHPNMKPYIVGVKGSDHINIIDLEKTKELFIQFLEALQQLAKEGKTVLFVGTKPPVRELVKNTATECQMPYVVNRWIGGTITNFSTIRQRIDYFKDLEKKREQGELEKYTKKEQLEIDREIKTLEEKFGGIKEMDKLPDAVFVVDMIADSLAVKEAKAKAIKILAVADTEADPKQADHFIPANDDARSSVKYILEKVKEAIIGANPKS